VSRAPWREVRRAFYVPGFDGSDLDVQLPDVTIEGRRIALPPIHFRRGSGTFASPLNC
jgi:hypothetical protein